MERMAPPYYWVVTLDAQRNWSALTGRLPLPASTFSENPIVEIVSNNFDNTVPSENLLLPSSGSNVIFPESSSTLSIPQPVPVNSEHSVPSFIDSERVNAGISEVSNEIDDGKFDIPHDLWREDTLSIQINGLACDPLRKDPAN